MKYIPFFTYIFSWTMYYLLQTETSWLASPSTANAAQIASAVITLAALLYTIFQGSKNREDIEKLASIAVQLGEANTIQRDQNKILSQQLKMDNKPVWKVNYKFNDDIDDSDTHLRIENTGKVGKLISVNDTKEIVTFYTHVGSEIFSGGSFEVHIRYGMHRGELFKFTYADILGNSYQATVSKELGEFLITNVDTIIMEVSTAMVTVSGGTATMTHRSADGSIIEPGQP